VAHRDLFISWMNDAYTMEESIIPVLENHIQDAKDHPQLQAKLKDHLDETHHHAAVVKECLQRLGKSPSTVKSTMAAMTGKVQGMSTGMADDELIKDGLSDFSTEYFEIASYKALITAARDLGEMECEQAFQEILYEEQKMAAWLDEQLPLLVQHTMRQAA